MLFKCFRQKEMRVNDIIENSLKWEGGYVNHPNDKGGPTNMGITLKTLRGVKPNASIEDIKKLTKETAVKIYKKLYYYGMGVDNFPQDVQDVVFDMNVLHGKKNSIIIVQRALRSLGASIVVDGIAGPKTMGAAMASNPLFFRKSINNEREKFVERIVARNPSQSVFLKGWKNRINSFRKDIEGEIRNLDN